MAKSKPNTRTRMREKRKREKLKSQLIWSFLGLLVLAIFAFLIWDAVRPRSGQEIPVMANSSDHIQPDAVPEYNSNPPTSGPHAASSLPADFYDEADLASLPPNPEVNLIHNMEHGHVIFWYNCTPLNEAACDNLKEQIREVMNDYNGVKVVAFPWDSIEETLVMTSWGRMERFPEFDAQKASRFIDTNQNRSPESTAP